MKLFWGNFYRHLANFFWSHWSRCNLQQYSLISGSGVAQLAERSLPVRIQSLANFNKPVGCFNSDGTNIAGILSLCQKKKVLYILYLKEFITYFGQFLGYWAHFNCLKMPKWNKLDGHLVTLRQAASKYFKMELGFDFRPKYHWHLWSHNFKLFVISSPSPPFFIST